MKSSDEFVLNDGAKIAVVGGGPSGSFFSIFALKMAKMIGKEISVTIFDPKEFRKHGPAGCNRCGGVISELLVQTLAIEGIILPDSVIQRGINSYHLHTAVGSAEIATPTLEKTIATVYRGGGPLGLVSTDKASFDHFLLDQAMQAGAVHRPSRVDRIEFRNGKPCLICNKEEFPDQDLVVGAFGVNSTAGDIFEGAGFGYQRPRTVTTAIAEIGVDPKFLAESFNNTIHLFLLPIKKIKFAAMIPKGTYVTVCILGKDLDAEAVNGFLDHEIVRSVLPDHVAPKPCCRCLPKMNVGAPRIPYADRIVTCGDSGSTRLFKDGLGAAYLMGKAAAVTAVFQGVSKAHFRKYYHPVYRSLVIDNWFGRYLFAITDLYKTFGVMTEAMLAVVKEEQGDPRNRKLFSSILWNMFTGNERYKNIFGTAISLPMHLDIWSEIARILIRRKP